MQCGRGLQCCTHIHIHIGWGRGWELGTEGMGQIIGRGNRGHGTKNVGLGTEDREHKREGLEHGDWDIGLALGLGLGR